MRYTLRQIEVFLAVAASENVSRAAEELSMSQSAASGALKELEHQFNVQLFDRIGKRLQLNEHGRQLRARAEALMARAGDMESELTSHSSLGNLTVGATLTIGNYLCVDLIDAYLERAPDARLNLKIANTQSIARELLDFDIDLGLLEGEIQHPDLLLSDWRGDELVCFCSPEHPYASRAELSERDLLEATWILREQGSGTRQTFERALHGIYPKLNIRLELEQTEAIKRAVRKNIGISCLSRIALIDEFRYGELMPLSTPSLNLERRLYIAIHRHKYRSPSIEAWFELCGVPLADQVLAPD